MNSKPSHKPWLYRLFSRTSAHDKTARQAIGHIIDQSKTDPSLEPEEKLLLSNILHLRDLTVVDIMTPRIDIEAVPVSMSYDDLATIVAQTPHSRLPVYGENLDEILGCLHTKDFVKAPKANFKCRNHLSQVLYVPQSTRVLDLLMRMKASQVVMAFVVDEFGGIDGLVTSWNIFREILGELDSLPTGSIPPVIKLSDQSLLVDGRYPLDDFVEEWPQLFEHPVQIQDQDTISGFIIALAGRVPAVHELVTDKANLQFEVVEADARRIKQVRIYRPQDTTE